MAQEDKQDETQGEADVALLLKKHARRRLVGAAALALLAAIVLPMVMDHEPAPPLKDIQVRIPSPDEGVPQRNVAVSAQTEKSAKVAAVQTAEQKAGSKPVPAPEAQSALPSEPKSEIKPIRPAPVKPIESAAANEGSPVEEMEKPKPESKSVDWEVQLGAYQEAGRVKLLLVKLKELGIPAYTEKVTTTNGPRTRVRAGPFLTREAADKARERVKIIGVDGPVAQKP